MRVDANVSVRPVGAAEFGTRCEIKNLNSLRSLGAGHRVRGGAPDRADRVRRTVVQETRHWDESAGRTESMRSKEEANDYRYFPEPDLVPLAPDEAWQEQVRAASGPCPPTAGPSWPPRSGAPPPRRRSTRSAPWSTSGSTAW